MIATGYYHVYCVLSAASPFMCARPRLVPALLISPGCDAAAFACGCVGVCVRSCMHARGWTTCSLVK